jgi:hypothetical protein
MDTTFKVASILFERSFSNRVCEPEEPTPISTESPTPDPSVIPEPPTLLLQEGNERGESRFNSINQFKILSHCKHWKKQPSLWGRS